MPETSGYLGKVKVFADSRYYVKKLMVTYNENPLELGFEAGSEHENFFRRYDFSPMIDEYQFLIPQEVVDAENLSDDDKIQVVIEYAKNPKTGDIILKYIIMIFISSIFVISGIIYLGRRHKLD